MGLDMDALKKKHDEQQSSTDGLFWKPEEGKQNRVRFLPRSMQYFSDKGDTDIAYEYRVHYNIFDVDGYKRIICKQSFGQKCPICDFAQGLDDKKRKNFKASEVHMYNVYDYEAGSIKVYESGPFIYGEILRFYVAPDWGNLFDLKKGRDIVIDRKAVAPNKARFENPYSVMPVPNVKDVSELLPENWDEIIDSLQTRLPTAKDDAFYLSIVEHLRNGTNPSPIEKEKKETAAPAANHSFKAPAAEKASETPVADAPKCFGLEYSPRLEKCKICGAKAECRNATLKL